jgi:hypothetical protein
MSHAWTAAFVFCAGVLCGSCVAPRSPWGPPPGGASSILAERRDGLPTRAGGPGLMNAPSIDSVSAVAGALRRLESTLSSASRQSDTTRAIVAPSLWCTSCGTKVMVCLLTARLLQSTPPSLALCGLPPGNWPWLGAGRGHAPASVFTFC